MTPTMPKTPECIAAETHMRDCPQCRKDPDARDGGLCEEGLRMLVEAVKAAKERRGRE